ncbi:MAG: 3-dehydroquinate synthase [Eubacteriales bacterium]|nr:3-dehydroquinate synthase [Eubacteriales bacterium]
MKTVNINASKSYEVYIEKGSLKTAGELAKKISKGTKAAVISDSNVAPIYGETVLDSLRSAGFEADMFVIEAGESSKNPENLVEGANFLLEKGLTRSDIVVAMGGGVITDLGGLLAAMYQRGISLLQIPTSLLAMVDSSVGGKTAVNLKSGKNMFGVFYQPSAVLCDSEVLGTLPVEEFSNGIAEVIKYAVLRGGKLVDILEKSDVTPYLDELIEECVNIKRDYVVSDEFDRGDRQFLNLGHTVGHAIERGSNFSVAHGSAVAAGMCIMARACEKIGVSSADTSKWIEKMCEKFALPTDTDISLEELYNDSMADKKREGKSLSFVMIKSVGECYLNKTDATYMKEILTLGNGGER